MTLFELLSLNERILVWSSVEDGLIVTWNQSLTLQWWTVPVTGDANTFEEWCCRTLSTQPRTIEEARAKAKTLTEDASLSDDR